MILHSNWPGPRGRNSIWAYRHHEDEQGPFEHPTRLYCFSCLSPTSPSATYDPWRFGILADANVPCHCFPTSLVVEGANEVGWSSVNSIRSWTLPRYESSAGPYTGATWCIRYSIAATSLRFPFDLAQFESTLTDWIRRRSDDAVHQSSFSNRSVDIFRFQLWYLKLSVFYSLITLSS